jgi:hypothetical protein
MFAVIAAACTSPFPEGRVTTEPPKLPLGGNAFDIDPTHGAPDLLIQGIDVQLETLLDDYEPNNEEPAYLGAGPNTFEVEGYLDEQDAVYQVTVANIGEGDSKGCFVDLYPNEAGQPAKGSDGEVFTSVSAIAPAQTEVVELRVNSVPAGEYHSWAVVDTLNSIYEKDESNNSLDVAVDVSEDVDWFEIFQDAGFSITVELESLPADYDVEIYRDGTMLDGSFNSGTTSESVTIPSAPASAKYQIKVFSFDGALDSDDSYALTVTLQ